MEQVLVQLIMDFPEISYKTFFIKKRNGKLRKIEAPNKDLKKFQQYLLQNYFNNLKVHFTAVGFIKNKNVKNGAYKHLNKSLLLCVDIKNFFTSIKKEYLYNIIKNIVKNDYDTESILNLSTYNGVLPQGAPTSPMLANAYCYELDTELYNLAKHNKLNYTRYADDLSFSSDDINFNFINLLKLITDILSKYGFILNHTKTRIINKNKRMTITGIVVNKKVNISKDKYKLLRAIIHNIKKHNIVLTAKEKSKLLGQISWVRYLNPLKGDKLLTQFNEYN